MALELLPVADQLSVIVLNLAAAPVEVAQRGVPPFAIPFLAAGLERIAYDMDIAAGLPVSTIWNTVTIVVPVVVVSVALLVSSFVVLLPVVILHRRSPGKARSGQQTNADGEDPDCFL
jgi:hypothetical protein